MHGELPLDPLNIRLPLTHLLIPQIALQMSIEGDIRETVAGGRLALLVVGAEFPALAAVGAADPDEFGAVFAPAARFEERGGGLDGGADAGEGLDGRDGGWVREGAVGWGDPGGS